MDVAEGSCVGNLVQDEEGKEAAWNIVVGDRKEERETCGSAAMGICSIGHWDYLHDRLLAWERFTWFDNGRCIPYEPCSL
jgi:hypothetical protein